MIHNHKLIPVNLALLNMDSSTRAVIHVQLSNFLWEEPNHVMNVTLDVLNVPAIVPLTHYHLSVTLAHNHSVFIMELA